MQQLDSFVLPEGFRGRSAFVVQVWWLFQALFINTSPQFLYGWRRFSLKLFGAKIGKDVLIRPSVKVTYPWKLSIGDYSWVGDNVELYSLGEIEIGSHAVISQKSYLCAGTHIYTKPTFDILSKRIVIGDGVWLCTDVFVAPGVTIGNQTVVGARSTVLTDLPKSTVCAGYPAQPIKPRVFE